MNNKKVKFTKEETVLLTELGNKVKEGRKKLGISQQKLAELTGIDRSYISMVERGETNITYLKLKKIKNIINYK